MSCMQPHRHLPATLCSWEDVDAAVASVRYASDEDLATRREQFLHSALVLACLSEAAQHLVDDDVAAKLVAAYPGLGGPRHRPCLALHRVGFA